MLTSASASAHCHATVNVHMTTCLSSFPKLPLFFKQTWWLKMKSFLNLYNVNQNLNVLLQHYLYLSFYMFIHYVPLFHIFIHKTVFRFFCVLQNEQGVVIFSYLHYSYKLGSGLKNIYFVVKKMKNVFIQMDKRVFEDFGITFKTTVGLVK